MGGGYEGENEGLGDHVTVAVWAVRDDSVATRKPLESVAMCVSRVTRRRMEESRRTGWRWRNPDGVRVVCELHEPWAFTVVDCNVGVGVVWVLFFHIKMKQSFKKKKKNLFSPCGREWWVIAWVWEEWVMEWCKTFVCEKCQGTAIFFCCLLFIILFYFLIIKWTKWIIE